MKKKVIVIVIVCGIIGVIALVQFLLNPQLMINEKKTLEKSLYITLTPDTKIFHSEGLKRKWFGEGISFFVFSVPENDWGSFIKENNFDNWSRLPISKVYKDELTENSFGLSETGAEMFLNSLNEKNGYCLIQNWASFIEPEKEKVINKQNLIICIISEKTKYISFCEIDF